ncbi:uncharacterized protein LOC131003749 [Salvia miltiorrhiza]|uniref:uncharacterized protein LOC131003749 n=1 Tax=Salvia miltiorrhiza TaxID=226208 RepID=UPI0025AD4CC9|nr:uncharacterized protein LOC131003749 [Salvia miltiorrhiza]
MNIITWNVRGLTDESKRLLKEHCSSFSPIILGLIEPKKVFRKVRQSYWNSLNMVHIHQNCRASKSSNIWVLAHPDVLATTVFSSDQSVIVDCIWQTYNFRVAVIHGANDQILRRRLWHDLLHFTSGNTVFIGDFNAVKGSNERISSRSPSRSSCLDFCAFIDDSQFIESPTEGIRFTWVLLIYGILLLPRRFRGSPLIILHMVKNSWTVAVNTRCPILCVMLKLKRLRYDIKAWNKDVFGNVDNSIGQFQNHLAVTQNQISETGYTDELFDEEIRLQAELNVALSRKNNFLQQKSRASWLQDGDRNTTFFHRMIKFKWRNTLITRLNIDGVDVYDPSIIEQHIIGHFSAFFMDDESPSTDPLEIEALIDVAVSDAQNNFLVSIPEESEIAAEVFGMDVNSAPGPDGFSVP